MKRMHETDGPKNFHHSYSNYPSHNYQHTFTHQNSNYSNGYQHNNGSYNPSGYNNNYRNNFGNRRFFKYNNKFFNHNHYGNYNTHQQYNQHHDCFPHSQSQQQPQQQSISNVGSSNSSVTTLIRKFPHDNCSHPYHQQQKSPLPPSSCSILDVSTARGILNVKSESSASSSSTCSGSSESEEHLLPLSQSQSNNNNNNSKINNATSTTTTTRNTLLPNTSLPPNIFITPMIQKDLQSIEDTLSLAINKKFRLNQQSPEVYTKKMTLWKELFALFKDKHSVHYPRYQLHVVGSTMSGFGSRSSDVDICLMIRRSEVDQRIEAVDRLHELQASLQKLPYIENIELIYAKVPILKFHDSSRDLDVDLNCNNSVGIRNTHLLYCYSRLDTRVKPLVLVIKLWAQYHGINDAKNMTISSYSLVLMVIHFLQFGCTKPVLPCLQELYPDKFSPNNDAEKIKINDDSLISWKSSNEDSLGDLLIQFLEYYSIKFDFSKNAISVRVGCHLPINMCMKNRCYKNDPHQWKYLCVEEPFDYTNTARSVYDKEAFDRIRGVFCASWQRLHFTRVLESIFHVISESESRAIAHRLPSVILR